MKQKVAFTSAFQPTILSFAFISYHSCRLREHYVQISRIDCEMIESLVQQSTAVFARRKLHVVLEHDVSC